MALKWVLISQIVLWLFQSSSITAISERKYDFDSQFFPPNHYKIFSSTKEDLLLTDFREILINVLDTIERCSLNFIIDKVFQDVLNNNYYIKENLADFRFISRMTYILPDDYHENFSSSVWQSLKEQLRNVKEKSCVHYVFVMKNDINLKRTISFLSQSSLELQAKFIIFIGEWKDDKFSLETVNNILKTAPLSNIINVLLVVCEVSSDTEVGELTFESTLSTLKQKIKITFFTHDFFTEDQKRVHSRRLGDWRLNELVLEQPFYNNRNHSSGIMHKWFPQKLKNFNHFQMKVSTFHYPPAVIFRGNPENHDNIDGLEVRLLKVLASALNFDFVLRNPKDGDAWGRELPNGSWTGSFGEVIRGEVEISFANFFITLERLELTEMTNLYHIDYTCFISPIPKPPSNFAVFIWPFHEYVWVAIVLSLLILPPVMMKASIMEDSEWFDYLSNCSLFLSGVFLNRSLPFNECPKSTALRLLLIFTALSALVIGVAYRSSLFSLLLLPSIGKPVDSLSQLLKSGLKWGVRDRGGWEKWFSDSIDPIAQQIASGFEFVNGIDAGISRVVEGKFAFMNSGTFLRYLVASNFTDAYGQAEFHVTKECFVPFRVGLALPKLSVVLTRFNTIIERVVEAGLVNQWFQNLLEMASIEQRRNSMKIAHLQSEERDNSAKVLGLFDLQGAFILLTVGWLIALLMLMVELTYKRYTRNRPTSAS